MPRVFEIESCIGRGGFGEVYAARVLDDGRRVALKVLHQDVEADSLAMERLRDESRMLQALDHPNILKAESMAVIAGRVALVTELIDGMDLTQLAHRRPLPPGAALEMAARVAAALDAAFNHVVDGKKLGLVHRDVKPANIRINRLGEVRLLDFGVARSDNLDREARTATNVVMGSLPFLSPEALKGGPVAPSIDVYALGATLYFAHTGQKVFDDAGPALFGLLLDPKRFEARQTERLKGLRDKELVALVQRMMSYDADKRPTHAEVRDVAQALAHRRDPRLMAFCAAQSWDGMPSMSGELSGQVLEEEMVDPRSIGLPPGLPEAGAGDSVAVTQLDSFGKVLGQRTPSKPVQVRDASGALDPLDAPQRLPPDPDTQEPTILSRDVPQPLPERDPRSDEPTVLRPIRSGGLEPLGDIDTSDYSASGHTSSPPRPNWIFPTKKKLPPPPPPPPVITGPTWIQIALVGLVIAMLMGAAFIFAFLLGLLLLR